MRSKEIPQDKDSFYDGALRACYAVDDEGRYVMTTSRGWQVETLATRQAIEDLERKLEQTRRDVVRGALSPLAYHMVSRMMTTRILAQSAGFMSWRVRRHLKPRVFGRLSVSILERYAEQLDLSIEQLRSVPDSPVRKFSSRRNDPTV